VEYRPDNRTPNVFLSYRREDTGPFAVSLGDRLKGDLRLENVFVDVRDVFGGDDWRRMIADRLTRSDVVVALIGAYWSGPRPDGTLRIFDVDDVVRWELERLCVQARYQARGEVQRRLTDGLSTDQRRRLDALTQRRAETNQSWLAWLRQMPEAAKPVAMLGLIERLDHVRAAGLDPARGHRVHQARLAQLVRDGGTGRQIDNAIGGVGRRFQVEHFNALVFFKCIFCNIGITEISTKASNISRKRPRYGDTARRL